jgi:hypothetical protein
MPDPILSSPTGISILGEYGAATGIRYARIEREFGGGYDQTELVGPTTGLLFLRLKYGFLPTDSELTVVDDENSNTVTPWAQYLWLKFQRRMVDGLAFTVSYIDPATNAAGSALFKFQDSELEFEDVTYLLKSSGVVLRQWVALT